MNWITIVAEILSTQIQRIETAQDLRELRVSLLTDQSLRIPHGVNGDPLWENEISDIDARLENLAAAASVEQDGREDREREYRRQAMIEMSIEADKSCREMQSEQSALDSIEYGIRTGQIAGGSGWFR